MAFSEIDRSGEIDSPANPQSPLSFEPAPSAHYSSTPSQSPLRRCVICDGTSQETLAEYEGTINGNTSRFRATKFPLWKCPRCATIHSLVDVDYESIYKDYPLNNRSLDFFAKATLNNLINRLIKAGLSQDHHILDYGCGNGLLITQLRAKGFTNVAGYDPYIQDYSTRPNSQFDCVIANDVIEHVDNPRALIEDCLELLKPGGIFYLGTADSQDVEMGELSSHQMRLHQPFHRIIMTKDSLVRLCKENKLELINVYTRSYMDTIIPFANYRFLDELSIALDQTMDRMLEPSSGLIMLKKPWLLLFGFFGYFVPSASEPAVISKKQIGQ